MKKITFAIGLSLLFSSSAISSQARSEEEYDLTSQTTPLVFNSIRKKNHTASRVKEFQITPSKLVKRKHTLSPEEEDNIKILKEQAPSFMNFPFQRDTIDFTNIHWAANDHLHMKAKHLKLGNASFAPEIEQLIIFETLDPNRMPIQKIKIKRINSHFPTVINCNLWDSSNTQPQFLKVWNGNVTFSFEKEAPIKSPKLLQSYTLGSSFKKFPTLKKHDRTRRSLVFRSKKD